MEGYVMNVGRWVGEVRDVWRSSYVDLGLILVAVGVAMMVPVILLQKVASPVVIAALGALAVPVVCWLSGVLHLICFRNAEAGESTSFGAAAAEAGARWDDVVLGVALYALLLG